MKYILAEVFEFIRNGASIKQFDTKEGYPITRIETIANSCIDINKLGYADIKNLGKYEDYLLRDGDILMSHINSEKHLGKTAIYENIDMQIIHGMNLLCLRPNTNILFPKYANYYFNNFEFRKQIPKITKKSVNQASFSVNDLKRLKIEVPNIGIQKKIVEVLDKAQELIDKRKAQIEDLDELVKSKFIEMFGDPFNDEKGFGKNKLGKVTEVNPKKAEIKELDKELLVSFVPMDRVGEKGEFNSEISKPISEVYSGFTYFRENDVLFAKITPCMENGKGAVAVNLSNGIGFGSTEFHVLRPIKENSNPYWIYHLTTLIEFRRLAERKMTGSAGQKRVPTDFLNNIEVVVPPIELQNQFADFVKQVDKLKFEMEESLKELEDNFNSLMQKAFSGKLFTEK